MEAAHPSEFVPSVEYLHGAIKTQDGLILIYDLRQFLALDEILMLDEALKERDKRMSTRFSEQDLQQISNLISRISGTELST